MISPHRLDGERADQLRQAALRLYASADRPASISKYIIGRAANLVRVVSSRSAYPQCNEVFDAFAQTQWHFYPRRYLWALAHLSGEELAAEHEREADIWHYKFVKLDTYFRSRSLAQVTRFGKGRSSRSCAITVLT